MTDSWYFNLEGPHANSWVWRRVSDDGCVRHQSRPFPYYLDAVRDAKKHGFHGVPEFGKPPAHVYRQR